MSKLITNQGDIAAAETVDLVYTYNTLEGKSIKKFETRATAETRVANAILAAENRAGHKGVKANELPKAADGLAGMTVDKAVGEIAAVKSATKATVAPKAVVDKNTKPKAPKAPKEPKAPKIPKVKVAAGVKILTITAAGAVECGIRAGTFRGQILQTLRNAGPTGCSKEAVITQHGSYTADVVCKFKRLGFITEAVVTQ